MKIVTFGFEFGQTLRLLRLPRPPNALRNLWTAPYVLAPQGPMGLHRCFFCVDQLLLRSLGLKRFQQKKYKLCLLNVDYTYVYEICTSIYILFVYAYSTGILRWLSPMAFSITVILPMTLTRKDNNWSLVELCDSMNCN